MKGLLDFEVNDISGIIALVLFVAFWIFVIIASL